MSELDIYRNTKKKIDKVISFKTNGTSNTAFTQRTYT